MLTHLYFAKKLAARSAGSRLVRNQCEKCRTEFFYVLSRMGFGAAEAAYYIGVASAKTRAGNAANKDLASRLHYGVELVPCPKCNWVNVEAIEQYRKRRFKKLNSLIIAIVIISVFTGGVVYLLMQQSVITPESRGLQMIVASAAMAVAGPLLVAWIRSQLRQRIDPNITYPSKPQLPPGTPPALMLRREAGTGHPYLEPAARETVQLADNRWAILRAGQSWQLQFCIVCMENAETVYRVPFTIDKNTEMPVPMCRACAVQRRLKWWMMALIVLALLALIDLLMFKYLTSLDETGRSIAITMTTIFGAILGLLAIPPALCRPYRMKQVDADRGVIRFAAENAEYTRQLAERNLTPKIDAGTLPLAAHTG